MTAARDTDRVRHMASLEHDSFDTKRGTWRCTCGFVRDVNGDHAAAENEVEKHVHGGGAA